MSVIQKIQEKYAKLMAVIIAIALIIFVIMLAFENGGGLFRGGTNTVGKVNGESIDLLDFQKKVAIQEDNMKQQYGGGGAALQQQAIEQVWSQEVNRLIMTAEFDKLGMQIGKKEIGDILYGANPPQDLRQQFTDPQTGVYNAQMAKQQIDQMLKTAKGEAKAQFNAYINYLENQRKNEKYVSLLSNSSNFPKWFIEKQNADNSQLAKVSFVREFYTSIPDSSVTISDSEVESYIGKHKSDFKQEESRGIAYVAFNALPNGADSAATQAKVLALKPALDSAKDVQQFLESQGVTNFYNGYINGSKIQIAAKDSIFRIPVGTVYGPYLDANAYSIAKLVGVRTQPDTVKIRHILVATAQQDPQTGQMMMVRDTASAKKLIDSIQLAIRGGSNFDTVCAKLSDDGTKDKGGVYENVTAGGMVPEFNDFIFGNPTGASGVVKTQFGYHYIEILSQKGSSPAYKVAYISQTIEASAETDNAANSEATKFAANSRDQKSFDANADKLKAAGIYKMLEPSIAPNAYQLNGLGISRAFVKSIYAADKGEVIQPERVGDSYVVAVVTDINEKGTMSAAKARPMVEPLLRNQKKAELLAKKIGTITTLEAAAAVLGGKAIETVDSLRISGSQPSQLSSEPKVIGSAFNPANKGKVITQTIPGNSGVFVVRVESVYATPVADANVAEQRKARYEQAKMRAGAAQQALVEAADIKDNRSKVY